MNEDFGVMKRNDGFADEQGYVTLLTPFRPLRFRYMAPRARRKGHPKRDYREHRHRERVNRANKALAGEFLRAEKHRLEIAELEALMDEMAAAGEIEKLPDGSYRPNLAVRMAHRRTAERKKWSKP